MIKTLHMQCFRKVIDETMTFTTGLNVLRGPNESSKTTRFEAVLYALFGAKSLRTPLAECVTWGRRESELKVALTIRVEGHDYVFTRSKSGAECNYAQGKVTGQAEVTAFASDLLGADAKTATMLMLSSQSGLRGALDDGPAAVSGLMAKLADFDLIDRIVDQAQANLLLGSEQPILEKLKLVETQIAETTVPDPAEWQAMERQRHEATKVAQALQTALTDVHQPAWQKALAIYTEASVANQNLERSLSQAQAKAKDLGIGLAEARRKLQAARAQAVRVDPAEIQAAQAELESFKNLQSLADAYAKVQGLPPYPVVFWEGDRASFMAEIDRLRIAVNDAERAKERALTEARTVRRNLIKGGKCPTCGHDAGNDEHVREHNAKVEAEAAGFENEAKQYATIHAAANADYAEMVKLLRIGETYDKVIDKLDAKLPLTWDLSRYPTKVEWSGAIPTPVNGRAVETKLKSLLDRDQAAVRAEGEAKSWESIEASLVTQLDAANAEVVKWTTHPRTDLDPLKAEHDRLYGVYTETQAEIAKWSETATDFERERDAAKREYETAVTTLASLKSRKDEYKKDLVDLTFNNNLLKKLRSLKPQITDSLWNTVLSAVSNFFSTLRGENSVVTKDGAGFKVNGQNVESLSGSTLDVLALAIRVALTKTFIPHSSFIVLDEPAHGADTNRTSNILGFLASVGFEQTLLASHDELSESVADNVILLEAA